MKRLLRIWLTMASREAQVQFLTSWAGILFIIGKVVRFSLFFVFLFSVLSSAKKLAGFTREQVILFFLVFTIIDAMVQFIFRGVYTFRFRVVSGDYDLDLAKPWPSFFRPIFGTPDFLDLFTLAPLWAYFIWFLIEHQLVASIYHFLAFLALLLNSLAIGFALHLLVCALAIITLKVDHLIWIYRDLTGMAKFPTDIYHKGIQYLLTFTIPVIILITIPAKSLLGLLTWPWVVGAFAVGGFFFGASLFFWKYALARYGSASS